MEINKVADKEEILRIYDENHNYLGKSEKRSVVHENRLFHNEIALWILDTENKKVLLQKRSPNKKQNPNKYALCAGHVVGDETIEEALVKEAKEEIGVDLNLYDYKPLTIIKRTEPKNYCFSYHFYIKLNLPIEAFVIQEEELSEVKYVDYEELKSLVKNNDESVVFKWNEAYKQVFAKLDEIFYNK